MQKSITIIIPVFNEVDSLKELQAQLIRALEGRFTYEILYVNDGSYDGSEKILPKTKEISIRLIIIYITLTFLCALFYKIFGMKFFDSLTHSMTTIATGGFSNYNDSIGHFNNFKFYIK